MLHAIIKVLLAFLAVLMEKETNGLQRFVQVPQYKEVNQGQDVLLPCKIADVLGNCYWQHDSKPVGIFHEKYVWVASPHSISIGLHASNYSGDCSLLVRSAKLELDDGMWVCQVSSSDFSGKDTLISNQARLVVRVEPQPPRLEYEGVYILPGSNITIVAGGIATVKCISHYGNPPAVLIWYLGSQEVAALNIQSNVTEPDSPRTWAAMSVVQIPALRERHHSIIKCQATHTTYSFKNIAVEAKLDIKYAPSIRLEGVTQNDIEEGNDYIDLRCRAEANPPANVMWRRTGRPGITSSQELLQLRPVNRRDAGVYTCQAENSVGKSETLSIQLDIKYPPKILSVGPEKITTAALYTNAAFECVAEGNPFPTLKWIQRVRSSDTTFKEMGHEPRLALDNITYEAQGSYECIATNFINGQERTSISKPIILKVIGAPQVLSLAQSQIQTVTVKNGDSVTLSLVLCADPKPHHVAWEWGSLRLNAGAKLGRYRVDEINEERENCYIAGLNIKNVETSDARPYYLFVANDRGTDRLAINLAVDESIRLNFLLGLCGTFMTVLLLLICICVYIIKTAKCCFKRKGKGNDSDKEDFKRLNTTGVPDADTMFRTSIRRSNNNSITNRNSPEAMKVRMSAMILQPPTRV